MQFIELVTAHAGAISALRDGRNELHNFFILSVLASRDDGRSNPSQEADLADWMK
jgi:hypothetical protein